MAADLGYKLQTNDIVLTGAQISAALDPARSNLSLRCIDGRSFRHKEELTAFWIHPTRRGALLRTSGPSCGAGANFQHESWSPNSTARLASSRAGTSSLSSLRSC